MKRREFITLLGGGLLADGALVATAAFAQGTGRWTIGTPMPSARTDVAVAEVGGKIYVVGGFGGERELEIYDPAANRWSRGASIPRELHHAAAVGWQEKLYIVGGFVEGWTPTDDVHEYDPGATCRSRKSYPARIRAMRQNQRIIRRDACHPPFAWDVYRQPIQVATPA